VNFEQSSIVPLNYKIGAKQVTVKVYGVDYSEYSCDFSFGGKLIGSGDQIDIRNNGEYTAIICDSQGNTVKLLPFCIDFLHVIPAFEGGDGSTENPYLIKSPLQLSAMRLNLYADYKIIAPIDFSDNYLSWIPIGTFRDMYLSYEGMTFSRKYAFCGTLDGNNQPIKRFRCVCPELNEAGLFGFIGSGIVKNLVMNGVTVCGKFEVGAIAAKSFQCERIYLSSSKKEEERVVIPRDVSKKHLLELINGRYFTSEYGDPICNCHVQGNVSSSVLGREYDTVGGLIGYCGRTIENCSFTGSVSGGNCVGGIAGAEYYINPSVMFCEFSGSVNAEHTAGGIIGDSGRIGVYGCSAGGDRVSAGVYAGGISGKSSFFTGIDCCYSSFRVIESPLGCADGIASGGMESWGGEASSRECKNYIQEDSVIRTLHSVNHSRYNLRYSVERVPELPKQLYSMKYETYATTSP